MILGVDVSKWQQRVDWQALRQAGVEFAIIKATQGNYHTDPLLKRHADGALSAGMQLGLYHWCDPLAGDLAQADYFLEAARDIPYAFAAADVEQFWADWGEWSRGQITKYLSQARIEGNAHNILVRWKQAGKKPVLYTRTSFIKAYSPQIAAWAREYPLWLAHYPYNATRITCSWADFKANHKPLIGGPSMPAGYAADGWTFWQFTGDKFALPGMWGDEKGTRLSAADVNYFNGSLAELLAFCGKAAAPEGEQPAQPLTVEARLERLEAAARAQGWKV